MDHNIAFHKLYDKAKVLNKYRKQINRLVYVMAVFGIVMTIPQVITIWFYKNAAGVSAISWFAYMITATFWFMYGIVHREKAIILTNLPWIFLTLFIIIGTVIYG